MFTSVSNIIVVLVGVLAIVSARPQLSYGFNNELGGLGAGLGGIGMSGMSRSKNCVNGICTERICSNGVCVDGMGGNGLYGGGMYGSGLYGNGLYGSGLYGSGLYGNGLNGNGLYASNPLLSSGLNLGVSGLSGGDDQIGGVLSNGMFRSSTITCINGICSSA